MKQYKCDGCGALRDCTSGGGHRILDLPNGWRAATLSAAGVPYIPAQSRDLCPTCLEAAGLLIDNTEESKQNTMDKLWDIMLDLAEEARDEI